MVAEVSKENLTRLGFLEGEELTEEGIEMARALLEHVKPVPNIPTRLFRRVMGLNVPVAVELVLIRPEDGAVFLTWREDEYWRGWHVPGSFISPGEELIDTARRIADNELRGVTVVSVQSIGDKNLPACPRFHAFGNLVFTASYTGEPGEAARGRWFTEWPEDLIEVHRPYIEIIDPYRKPRKG